MSGMVSVPLRPDWSILIPCNKNAKMRLRYNYHKKNEQTKEEGCSFFIILSNNKMFVKMNLRNALGTFLRFWGLTSFC